MDARRHQVVHHVIAAGHRIEHAANQAFLLIFVDRFEAKVSGFATFGVSFVSHSVFPAGLICLL